MTEKSQYDIAIIGGGMVGASLACLLAAANRDWQIVLIEAFPFPVSSVEPHYQPSFDARSSAIAHGSVDILQQLGLWQRLCEHASAIQQVHVSDRGHFGGTMIDAAEHGLEAVGYVVENAWLGSVLLGSVQQQANITCLAPARVTKLIPKQHGAQLKVQLQGNEGGENNADQTLELNCQLAVIADGGDSPLRKALGIDTEQSDYQQQAIIANVGFSEPHNHIAFERFTDQGPMALLPLSSVPLNSAPLNSLPLDGAPVATAVHRSALVWTQPADQAERVLGLSDEDFLPELQQRFGHRLGRFTHVGARHAYPLKLITATEQVRSGVVIAGNAAHFLHPVAGQGFNLALRDCATLVDVLRQGAADGQRLGDIALLQEYLRLQDLDQQATIGFSDTITKLFSTAQLPAAVLRNLGFLGLELVPAAKSLLAQQTMGQASRRARLK